VSTTVAGHSPLDTEDRAVHPLVRFSPHYYNTEEELDRAVQPRRRDHAPRARPPLSGPAPLPCSWRPQARDPNRAHSSALCGRPLPADIRRVSGQLMNRRARTEERNGRFGWRRSSRSVSMARTTATSDTTSPSSGTSNSEILLADKFPGHVCRDRPGAENLVALSRKIADICRHISSGRCQCDISSQANPYGVP